MQNWYSQNNPFRSNGVAVGIRVGGGGLVAIDASVVATASSMGMMGVAVALPGKEQDVIKSPAIVIINKYCPNFLRQSLKFNIQLPPTGWFIPVTGILSVFDYTVISEQIRIAHVY